MNNLQPEWTIKAFNELTANELYELLALRIKVFIVEQSCPYQEADSKDINSLHVMGHISGKLCAYSRIVKPGISYKEISIGRVCTAKSYRGQGLGKKLMQVTVNEIKERFGDVPVKISAQSYLVPFYGSFGFKQTGDEYLEDDMPHTPMCYEPIV